MFLYFDIISFLADKELLTVGIQEWKDYESQKVLGTKVEVVIISDETDYGNPDGEIIINYY